MSASNFKDVPKSLQRFMTSLKTIELLIIHQGGVRHIENLEEAARIYTDFLGYVMNLCKEVERFREEARSLREHSNDIYSDEPLPSDKWRDSFEIPSVDELEAYMKKMVNLMDEEIRVRQKYNISKPKYKPEPVQGMRGLFDTLISKLHILDRLKRINGEPVPITEEMAGIINILNQPGANEDDLVPLYANDEEAAADADRMIAEILAEN
ncbi:uncharacterized protein TRUGW13939_01618 [Talaromyces rugulosus]|uniref:Uncharacterized protein n=1 Tax=Talaromyces rugulosus TaxID=121627 RepID=A0A7H8QLX5_TALRU|nr:uncharacterized protein TRUGW13939_01618 [Talaromyces rugulosus]QKX54531.1 hypothetical protein TRUGW13939_01618 [Talaromyces rugulosus]